MSSRTKQLDETRHWHDESLIAGFPQDVLVLPCHRYSIDKMLTE
jgi:hypothetical protein